MQNTSIALELLQSAFPDLYAEVTKQIEESGRKYFDGEFFVSRTGVHYRPHDAARNFIKSNALLCLFLGGRGAGKTAAGSQKTLDKVINHGLSGAIMNPDFANLRFSTWPEFLNWLPIEALAPASRERVLEVVDPNQSFKLVFKNGAFLWIKGAKGEGGVGGNLNFIWVDEAARSRDGVAILRAMGSARVGNNPQVFFTTTPAGRKLVTGDTHWLYSLFFERRKEEINEYMIKFGRPLVEIFTAKSHDNQFVAKGYGDFLTYVYGSNSALAKQEIDGEFVDESELKPDLAKIVFMTDEELNKLINDRKVSIMRKVRFWDIAASRSSRADKTVGSLVYMILFHDSEEEKFALVDQVAGRVESTELFSLIAATAVVDGPDVSVAVEQEPGASGKITVDAIRDFLYSQLPTQSIPSVVPIRPTLNRVEVASYLLYPMITSGRLLLIQSDNANWLEPFWEEMTSFPAGRHDDHVTSLIGALTFFIGNTHRGRLTDFVTVKLPFFRYGGMNG